MPKAEASSPRSAIRESTFAHRRPSPLYLEDECIVYLPDEEEQVLDSRRFTFRTMKARKTFLAPDESITNRIPVGDLLDHSPQKDCRAAALPVRYKFQWPVVGGRRSGMFYEYKRLPVPL